MKLMRVPNNCNKINTKEELIELVNSYKGILTDSIINYLNSLINLEFSVIRDYINDKDRLALSELEVYKRIAMYNIYNRALNIFEQSELQLEISSNNEGNEGLDVYISLGERECKLFDFNYREGPMGFKEKIPSGYKTMNIGNISLYQTIENFEQREVELMRVMSVLERLYDEQNPYSSYQQAYGGPSSRWEHEHLQKIRLYEEKFNQLDAKKELTDEDKKEIEITTLFHNLILEDFGLSKKNFVEENDNSFSRLDTEKTKLTKTLVKKIPNLIIKDNIKYL